VLRLAASGLSVNATAESLSLKPSTVKTHLDKSYMKLSVSSKAAAVAQALRRGLIE
jgi:two-component system nitrate/nitrite response regulator NarL